MTWLIENKEWVFSGIGVFIVSIIFAYFFKKYNANNIRQSIKSGKSSNNIQTSGNVTVNIGRKNEE
ncbi:hypothetical protein [Vibrio cholerae]|uniref:hypothetical protein n=1 Tax=Vibrio cholerae TaxID=666 RepID=UPI00215BCF14|nr:hypothetical protein [Vibrio cholerae]MCR9797195.1 hypothetical protein [Vibrio cholerae]